MTGSQADENCQCKCGIFKGPKLLKWVVLGVSFVAFIFSCVVAGSCAFVKFDRDAIDRKNNDDTLNSKYDPGVGLFKYEVAKDICIPLKNLEEITDNSDNSDNSDNFEISGSIKAAQAFGTMASLFGAVAVVGLLIIIVGLKTLRFTKILWIVCMVLLFAAALFQVLIFVYLSDKNCKKYDCKLGPGGIINCFAFLLWLASGIIMLFAPVPAAPALTITKTPKRNVTNNNQRQQPAERASAPAPAPRGATEVSRVVNPDGSITVTTVTNDLESNNREHYFTDRSIEVQSHQTPPSYIVPSVPVSGKEDAPPPPAQQQVFTSTVENSDGTITTTTRTHNPDGSVTITESISNANNDEPSTISSGSAPRIKRVQKIVNPDGSTTVVEEYDHP